MSHASFCGSSKIPKLKCVFPSVFTQRSLSKLIAFCSSFISSINFFAPKPNLLKETIAFGSFEPLLMFLIAFNCFFLDLQLLLKIFQSLIFSLSSIFFSIFKGPSYFSSSFKKIYSTENTQI